MTYMPLQERNCSCIFQCGILAERDWNCFEGFTGGGGGGGATDDEAAILVH